MRMAILILGGLIVAVGAFTGILRSGKEAQAMNVKLNVKDFPEHGVTIISASDPSFDGMMTALLSNRPHAPVDELKPFSVFIKNAGKGEIVAYKLRWACMKADRTMVYKESSHSSAWILMNEGGDTREQAAAHAQNVIRRNSTWFYSLVAPPQPLESPRTELDSGYRIVANDDNADQLRQILEDPSEKNVLKALNAELAQYTSITVSLDGAFFDDGSFIGSDSTNFFGAVKAQIDAKYDLLRDVQDSLKSGKASGEILRGLKELADGQEVDLGPESTASDYYNYFKKVYAQEYVANSEHSGGDKAIKEAVKQLERPWAKLRKL